MSDVLDLLRTGAGDEEVLAWDKSADAEQRTAVVEVLKRHEVYFDQRGDPAVALAILIAGHTASEVSALVRWCRDPSRPELVDAVLRRRTRQWLDTLVRTATTDRFSGAFWLVRAAMRLEVGVEPGPRYLEQLLGAAVRDLDRPALRLRSSNS